MGASAPRPGGADSPPRPAVQHECIPQAILGMDVLCQAKSGMGKTAVFVLATLQQLEPVTGQVRAPPAGWGGFGGGSQGAEPPTPGCASPQVSVLVMCHTRELAFQISKEYERFSKYMPSVKVRALGGVWGALGGVWGCWVGGGHKAGLRGLGNGAGRSWGGMWRGTSESLGAIWELWGCSGGCVAERPPCRWRCSSGGCRSRRTRRC